MSTDEAQSEGRGSVIKQQRVWGAAGPRGDLHLGSELGEFLSGSRSVRPWPFLILFQGLCPRVGNRLHLESVRSRGSAFLPVVPFEDPRGSVERDYDRRLPVGSHV